MRTILVIDDHVVTLDTLCTILAASGYRILKAQDSQQAEQQFVGNDVDLVIVDHGLPGISGSVVAERLKQIKSVPVLMLSGNPELKGKPDSVDLLLPKPQSIPDLLASIAEMFEARQDSLLICGTN
jgi:two-component system phosphate regulon response regulator OmpR